MKLSGRVARKTQVVPQTSNGTLWKGEEILLLIDRSWPLFGKHLETRQKSNTMFPVCERIFAIFNFVLEYKTVHRIRNMTTPKSLIRNWTEFQIVLVTVASSGQHEKNPDWTVIYTFEITEFISYFFSFAEVFDKFYGAITKLQHSTCKILKS